jgi:hypothetical protein
MVLFYIYFNPHEAILYSSQLLLPLVFLFAAAFDKVQGNPRIKYNVSIAVVVLIAFNNCLTLYGSMREGI